MVELQTTWSWLPAIYLFLGGLSAGAFLTVSILRLVKPDRFKKTVTGGVWTAVAALAIGLLALVSEVEKPFQAMILFKSFVNGSSWMTIGAWLLLVTFVVFVLSALFTTDKLADWLGKVCKPFGRARAGINKVLAIVGIPCSLAVAAYTGVLLSAAPAIPLWNTWLLPALFTVSALDTGVAAVSVFAAVLEKDEDAHGLRTALEWTVLCLVAIEAVVLAAFLTTMQGSGADEVLASGLLVSGPLSMQFWALVVAVGLVGPFLAALVQVATAKRKKDAALVPAVPVGGAACALVGGFTLRFLVLAAGLHAALVSPAALHARFAAHARPEGGRYGDRRGSRERRGEGGHVLVSVGHVFAGGFAGFFGASGCGAAPSWRGAGRVCRGVGDCRSFDSAQGRSCRIRGVATGHVR